MQGSINLTKKEFFKLIDPHCLNRSISHVKYRTRLSTSALSLTAFYLFSMAAPSCLLAQTLNEAVNLQLGVVPIGFVATPCGNLLGPSGNAVIDLEGGLEDICTRSLGAGGPIGGQTTGGGAATPVTLPGIIKRRLNSGGVGEEDSVLGGGGSADIVADIGPRTSLFFSAEYEDLDRDVTDFEDGYNSEIYRLAVGADHRVNSSILIGAAVDGYNHDGDYKNGGEFDIDAFGLLLFGAYRPVDAGFVQFSAGVTQKSNDRDRPASYTAESGVVYSGQPRTDYDANEYRAGILAGYDYSNGPYTVGPRFGLDWVRTEFDTYSERGTSGLELTFHGDDVTSMQSTVGIQGSMAIGTGFGVLLPQLSLDWKHEFDNDQRDVQVSFVGDTRAKRFVYETEDPDRDFFELNAAVIFVLPRGVHAFANYRTLLGHKFFDSHAISLGLRVDL